MSKVEQENQCSTVGIPCEDCPNRYANALAGDGIYKEDSAVTLYDDGQIAYNSETDCGMSIMSARGELADKVSKSIEDCEGPVEYEVSKPVIGNFIVKKEVRTYCGALVRHFDTTSQADVQRYFEGS